MKDKIFTKLENLWDDTLDSWECDSFIEERKGLKEFKRSAGVGDNWHEPDEQEVSATVTGDYLDNAGCGSEFVVHLEGPKGLKLDINLASLLSLATVKWEEK